MSSRARRRLPVLLLPLATASCRGDLPLAPTASACANPAAVRNARDSRDPSMFVYFGAGVDASTTRGRLEAQVGFKIHFEFDGPHPGFTALLTDAQIATVRCDAAVAFLEWAVLGMAADMHRIQ